jgi:hypothetical protein
LEWKVPPSGKGVLTDYQRAEELLRQGYAVKDVRDRDAIADWLRLARDKRPRQPRSSGLSASRQQRGRGHHKIL